MTRVPRSRISASAITVSSLVLAGSLFAGSMPATAQTPAEFYKGRDISTIIGFFPGGGYNAYMRLLSKHMGRHIPGNPTIVPRNKPGAGSLLAANYLYNVAPKDGSVLGIFASSTLFSKLLGEKKAKFEIAKFTWVGNLDVTTGTCAVWHESGIKSFDEFHKREIVYGAAGPGSVNSQHPRGFNALLGTKIKVIHGFPGSTGVLLAMQRGEVDGGCGFALSSLKARRRQVWKQGKLIVVIQTGAEKSPDLKGVPHLYAMAKSEDDKKVMDLIFGTHAMGRPIAAPPGVPADRLKALRTAFNATVKDAEFLKDAKKRHLPINPWTGEKTTKFVAQYAAYPKRVVNRAIKALEIGEVVKVKLKKLSGTIKSIKKRKLVITDASGKDTKIKVHPRRTKLTIAGNKAKPKDLKVNMSCSMDYFGAGDLAKKMSCK